MIFTLQFISLIFSLFMVYVSIIHYKKNELNKNEIMIWVGIWAFVILVILFPDYLRRYSTSFSVARLFDLMVAGGFIVVIYLSSSAYLRARANEKKLEELVRGMALKNVRKNK